MSLYPSNSSQPQPRAARPEEAPRLILEVTTHRCNHACPEAYYPPEVAQRPFLVKVILSEKMKTQCLMKAGEVPPGEQYVCVNYRCGALMQALKALAPLQEAVK